MVERSYLAGPEEGALQPLRGELLLELARRHALDLLQVRVRGHDARGQLGDLELHRVELPAHVVLD